MAKVSPWKHGILNNSFDDARDAISGKLSEWKHPLDTRRKDNNRLASDKWFTGERFATFMKGERGSPGGPVAIAMLVLIVADDLISRGVARGSGSLEDAVAPAPTPAGNRGNGRGGSSARGRTGGGRGRGRSKAAFADRRTSRAVVTVSHPDAAEAVEAELIHVPTKAELDADPADLDIIRQVFGSRAQTLINALLSWDAFMAWYFALKESVPFLCPLPQREERALDNMQKAVDMFEIYERVCLRNSKSFMPHAAVYKMTRDILTLGDIWAVDLSALELHNAEAKRAAENSGSRRLEMSSSGKARQPLISSASGLQGPARLVNTKGYSTTMAISVMKHLLMLNVLRRGDGLYHVSDTGLAPD